jgi:hypothetical protein
MRLAEPLQDALHPVERKVDDLRMKPKQSRQYGIAYRHGRLSRRYFAAIGISSGSMITGGLLLSVAAGALVMMPMRRESVARSSWR